MILKDSEKYPALTEFINSGGRLEIGYIHELGISALLVDEGGTVWEGEKEYESIEILLDKAENAIKEWMDNNW